MAKLGLFVFKPLNNAWFVVCILFVAFLHTSSCSEVFTGQVVNMESDLTGSVNGQCQCAKLMCGCCQHFQVDRIRLNDTVCVNVTYLRDEYGIRLTLTIGKRLILNYTVSAKNPPPICYGVPYLKKLASLCVKFYNISYSKRQLKACVKIIVRLSKVPFEDLELGCFSIPPTASLTPGAATIDTRTLYLMMKNSPGFRDAFQKAIANRHTPVIGQSEPKLLFKGGNVKDSDTDVFIDVDFGTN